MYGAVLHLGAAATVLRTLPRASVDMVYADPPFGNKQDWTGKAGSFTDKWSENEASAAGWARLRRHSPAGAALMAACCPTATHRGYLGTMADILLGCRRVLRFDGSLWLHFDDTMGAHLRVLLDVVFGPARALGLLIWKRRAGGGMRSKAAPRVHDTIAVYGRTRAARRKHARIGMVPQSLILDVALPAGAGERVGYPTQKPVALLGMFIKAGTWPGETVLDPTCGSGTTLVAATELSRRAIGIDLSPDAIRTAEMRLAPKPDPRAVRRDVKRASAPVEAAYG